MIKSFFVVCAGFFQEFIQKVVKKQKKSSKTANIA